MTSHLCSGMGKKTHTNFKAQSLKFSPRKPSLTIENEDSCHLLSFLRTVVVFVRAFYHSLTQSYWLCFLLQAPEVCRCGHYWTLNSTNLLHRTQQAFCSIELEGTGINNVLAFLVPNLKLLCQPLLQSCSIEYNFHPQGASNRKLLCCLLHWDWFLRLPIQKVIADWLN